MLAKQLDIFLSSFSKVLWQSVISNGFLRIGCHFFKMSKKQANLHHQLWTLLIYKRLNSIHTHDIILLKNRNNISIILCHQSVITFRVLSSTHELNLIRQRRVMQSLFISNSLISLTALVPQDSHFNDTIANHGQSMWLGMILSILSYTHIWYVRGGQCKRYLCPIIQYLWLR